MRILILFYGLLFSGLATAGGIDQLKAFWANTYTAQGAFLQSVVSKSGKKPQNSAGSFALARPGKLRWVYERPMHLILVADGERLWSFDADLNQVTVSKLDQALGATPAALLTGEALDRHFSLSEGGRTDDLDIVVAVPKSPGASAFTRVRIGMQNNLPRLMEVEDNFGQTTTLVFTELTPNPLLGRETFRFVPPKGADVIDAQ